MEFLSSLVCDVVVLGNVQFWVAVSVVCVCILVPDIQSTLRITQSMYTPIAW